MDERTQLVNKAIALALQLTPEQLAEAISAALNADNTEATAK